MIDKECLDCKRYYSKSCNGVEDRGRDKITIENCCSGHLKIDLAKEENAMDFITKNDKDLHQTEILYGKKSDQYALHSLLLNAENKLKTTGYLVIGKQCKQEYITITFYIMSHINTDTIKKVKTHWNKEKTEVRKTKELVLNKSISSLVDNDVYDLILNEKYKLEE